MKDKSEKEKIIDRLNRIAGQISGISGMIEQNRDCISVLQQLMAVRSALAKVASKIVAFQSCQVEVKENPQELEKIINQFINLK
ncbi:metal-sensitive transcriptional regulator [Candidatus Beckwithbacteria bacterium]|nr:metal-sensitive transcriptional regulator [Candidatus Beckwithbacteria bacterium]